MMYCNEACESVENIHIPTQIEGEGVGGGFGEGERLWWERGSWEGEICVGLETHLMVSPLHKQLISGHY